MSIWCSSTATALRGKGGPLFQPTASAHPLARRIGHLAAERNGWAWEPAPLIASMAAKAPLLTLNA
jgi:3-hydroxyacyl-CoA dehydrogenase